MHRSLVTSSVFLISLVLLVLSGCTMTYPPPASAASAAAPAGVSAPLPPSSSLVGRPSLSVSFMHLVLVACHSPAVGTEQALYDEGVTFHIDPAYALAFFVHESSCGTRGEARSSLSLGNLRCITGALCRDGYAWFPSWQAGFHAWYVLIAGPLYVGAGLTTVEQIIPRYAPSADHNDEQAYIQAVKSSVSAWRSGQVQL